MKKRILTILCALCMVCSLLPTVVLAEEEAPVTSGTFGEGLSWTFEEATGTLTISGEGAMPDFDGGQSAQPWGDHAVNVKHVIVESGITALGQQAFAWFENVESVVLPEGLTSIGIMAFYSCYALSECDLPSTLTTIGKQAFDSSGLTSITIPGGVRTITNSAFNMCAQLKTVVMEEGVEVIENGVFANGRNLISVTFPESLTTIGETAFVFCDKLPEITFPKGITSLGKQAFWAYNGETSLTKITFEGDAPQIAEDCFQDVVANVYYPADNATWTEDVRQNYGGTLTWKENDGTVHHYESAVTTEPNCTDPGVVTYTCTDEGCGDTYTEEIPALGHDFADVTPVFDAETRTHSYGCTRCEEVKTEDCTFEESEGELGVTIHTCTVCGGCYEAIAIRRLYGSSRYDTAYAVADALKEQLGVDKFENIVVASGMGYADALSGSYLATQKNAPILLVNQKRLEEVANYIQENLAEGGTVYLLGGKGAIPTEMEGLLEGIEVIRLAGKNRYETNMAILEEAGTEGSTILVCTGHDFPDSLAASAAGQPILLVNKTLYDYQKEYLAEKATDIIIIGGTGAVSMDLETELYEYGTVFRFGGAGRYETCVMVAKHFFPVGSTESAVIAYSRNFPDGLCGGPLAYAMDAPLLLLQTGRGDAVIAYAQETGFKTGVVLGGESLVDDATVQKVFMQ